MSTTSALRRALLWAAAIAAGAMAAQAQVTITNADMFNQAGQYYMTYINASSTNSSVDVSAVLGTASSVAQAWNFITGPQDLTNRYDYLAAGNTPYGADFVAAGAKMAQQLNMEGTTNGLEWQYFTEDPVKGQLDYGFYNPQDGLLSPEAVFSPALQDFPASMKYGDSWSGTTSFTSTTNFEGFGFTLQLTLTSTDEVDAFGLVTLPSIGFLDCIRVHELDEWDVSLDGEVNTYYVLNYYWFAPGHGMVAQINSQQNTSIPPDDLGGQAATFERMFEAYHPVTTVTNTASTNIVGFTLTLGNATALLQWTPLTGASSYTVQYATNLAGAINWQSLGSTTSNFMLDPAAATSAAPVRYYRVIGTVGSK
jgi:hypothetical protein